MVYSVTLLATNAEKQPSVHKCSKLMAANISDIFGVGNFNNCNAEIHINRPRASSFTRPSKLQKDKPTKHIEVTISTVRRFIFSVTI